MAMIAAKGRLPDSAPQETLDGAKIRHTTSRASVERRPSRSSVLRHGNHVPSRGKTIVVVAVWFISPIRAS